MSTGITTTTSAREILQKKNQRPLRQEAHPTVSSRRKRCTVPWALAAQSSAGLTEGGLKPREWIVEVVVPRRSVCALLTSGSRNTRMTVPFWEAEASRLPS